MSGYFDLPMKGPTAGTIVRCAAIAAAFMNGGAIAAGIAPSATTASALNACSVTAANLQRACGYEVLDDYWVQLGVCANESDPADKQECLIEAAADRTDNQALCSAQATARVGICKKVGEAPYDPEFEPVRFVSNFRANANLNPYFPLGIGNRWTLSGDGETVNIEILNRTKLIDEVPCLVVRDQVFIDGQLVEDTDDWFALAKNGDVWYCGEEVKDYETFPGDRPAVPELIAIDGSFKADRDDAKPGVLFFAKPQLGKTYREEFSLGNAEDVSTIVSTTYGYGANPSLDTLMPAALANLLCRSNCVVTHAFTATEPGIVERKFYAPGIGFFFQVNLNSDETVQLTACNFDPRCSTLPQPAN